MARPNNDFTNVVLKEASQEYAAFRVFKHYVVDEADNFRMVQYLISREEAAEGTEILRDTAKPLKVSFRIFSRDRVLLMDWQTDDEGVNLLDGNTFSNTLDPSGDWDISNEPAGAVYNTIDEAISRHLDWIQYEPA